MPDNQPRFNQLGNPMPSPISIDTDDGATAALTWIFEHDEQLLRSILGIFRCRRGLGDDPAAAFNHAVACFVAA